MLRRMYLLSLPPCTPLPAPHRRKIWAQVRITTSEQASCCKPIGFLHYSSTACAPAAPCNLWDLRCWFLCNRILCNSHDPSWLLISLILQSKQDSKVALQVISKTHDIWLILGHFPCFLWIFSPFPLLWQSANGRRHLLMKKLDSDSTGWPFQSGLQDLTWQFCHVNFANLRIEV